MREYNYVDIQVLLSAPATPLCKALKDHGFFNRFSSERLFPNVATAVKYARDGNKVVSVRVEPSNKPKNWDFSP